MNGQGRKGTRRECMHVRARKQLKKFFFMPNKTGRMREREGEKKNKIAHQI